jgi:hypothetical protein
MFRCASRLELVRGWRGRHLAALALVDAGAAGAPSISEDGGAVRVRVAEGIVEGVTAPAVNRKEGGEGGVGKGRKGVWVQSASAIAAAGSPSASGEEHRRGVDRPSCEGVSGAGR